MSFQASYISLFKDAIQNFHLTSYISWCCQTFIKKLFMGQCSFTHIALSRILHKFLPKLFVVQCNLTHIVLSRILYKVSPKLVLKYLLKNCIWDITVWYILYFQRSYSYTNFHQKLFLCSKNFSKKFMRDNMVWSMLSFWGSYIIYKCSSNASIFFGVKNLFIYWNIFSFQGFYIYFHRKSFFANWNIFEKF